MDSNSTVGRLSALREALNWLHQRCKQCRCMGSDGWHEFCAFETKTLKPLLAMPQSERESTACLSCDGFGKLRDQGNIFERTCKRCGGSGAEPVAAAAPEPAPASSEEIDRQIGHLAEWICEVDGYSEQSLVDRIRGCFDGLLPKPAPTCEAPPAPPLSKGEPVWVRGEFLSGFDEHYSKVRIGSDEAIVDNAEIERALAASVPLPTKESK